MPRGGPAGRASSESTGELGYGLVELILALRILLNYSGFGCLVGQDLVLRRLLEPPCAGPWIFFWLCHEARRDRVVFDVALDVPKFTSVAHQMVVAFILPEGWPVRLSSRLAFLAVEFLSEPSSFDTFVKGVSSKWTWLGMITKECVS